MALNITFHIDDTDIPIVLQAFQASSESRLPQQMVDYLLERVTHVKRETAWRDVAEGNEITIQ